MLLAVCATAAAASAQLRVVPLSGPSADIRTRLDAVEKETGEGLNQRSGRGQASCFLNDMVCNSTVDGTLSDQDCDAGDGSFIDFWAFDGQAGQTVTVEMTSTSVDAFLLLLDPAPSTVAQDDDGGGGSDARIEFTLDSTGEWTIGANSFAAGETGDYQLTLTCSGIGGGGVPAAPSNLQAQAVATNEVQLSWNDNSNNEDEFRVEVRSGGAAFTDVGSVPANTTLASVQGFPPNTTVDFRIRARNADGDSPYSNIAMATTFDDDGTCVETATALCLNNDRFRVETRWRRTNGTTGMGTGVQLTGDTGYFWFFNPANVEMVVKVLNGCPSPFNSYWVFAGGLTNVEVTMTVTDTQNGQVKTYVNPLTMPFQPIQDTSAFATCP